MQRHRSFGLQCRWCRRPVKELASCDLTFEGKTVSLNLCFKCLTRFGLKEKPKEDAEAWLAGDPPK